MRFEDETVVVTGAASGIGRATAELFACEGATVVVADIDEEGGSETVSTVEKAGGVAEFRRLDVRDPDRIRVVVKQTIQRHGLDVLINNAGTGHSPAVLEDVEDEWRDNVIATNLLSVWNGCQAVLPHLKEQGSGAIVNVASINGFLAMPRQGAYGMTKAAIMNLTSTVAKECGPEGVRANAVCPGFIETPLTTEGSLDSGNDDIENEEVDGVAERWDTERIPLRRTGGPEEVASCIAFLASEDASYVNGESLVIDGGTTS